MIRILQWLLLYHLDINFLFNFDFLADMIRILQWGEDRRFDEMRSNLGKLAIFWIFQVFIALYFLF
jgi:hypothetical protein